MSRKLENSEQRGPRIKEKEWMEYVADGIRVRVVWDQRECRNAALELSTRYDAVNEGGTQVYRLTAIAAERRDGERAAQNCRREREEAADEVVVATGVAVESLRRFRAALVGPPQATQKWRSRVPCAIAVSVIPSCANPNYFGYYIILIVALYSIYNITQVVQVYRYDSKISSQACLSIVTTSL